MIPSLQYSFLHVTPPQVAPKVLEPFADANGFVDVDKHTLQSTKFNNVFALGDCVNVPTGKTGAAVAQQNRIVFDNLKKVMGKAKPSPLYHGYSSCPLVTGNGKCVMAEFDYDLKAVETFPFDQGKERRSMYFVKTTVLPWIYWNLMLK